MRDMSDTSRAERWCWGCVAGTATFSPLLAGAQWGGIKGIIESLPGVGGRKGGYISRHTCPIPEN